MKAEFLTIPSDEQLRRQSTWRKKGDTWSVVRTQLMIVRSHATGVKKGPMIEGVDYPADSEVTTGFKVTYSLKLTEEVTRTLEKTVAKKINHEIASVLKSSATSKVPGVEMSLQSELQSRIGLELTESLHEGISDMRRIEAEQIVEDSTTVKLTLKEDSRITVYMMLVPTYWDVYLVRAESMTLQWKDSWYWPTVRKTMDPQVDEAARPLFRLVVYEPQGKASITLKQHVPEINESSFVEVQPLDGAVPRRKQDELTPLRDLARTAFPTKIERLKAKLSRGARKVRRTAATGAKKATALKRFGSSGSSSLSRAAASKRSPAKTSARVSQKAPSSGTAKARPKARNSKRSSSKRSSSKG
jgi:hypothetical protein